MVYTHMQNNPWYWIDLAVIMSWCKELLCLSASTCKELAVALECKQAESRVCKKQIMQRHKHEFTSTEDLEYMMTCRSGRHATLRIYVCVGHTLVYTYIYIYVCGADIYIYINIYIHIWLYFTSHNILYMWFKNTIFNYMTHVYISTRGMTYYMICIYVTSVSYIRSSDINYICRMHPQHLRCHPIGLGIPF